jgi:hypothetical protein
VTVLLLHYRVLSIWPPDKPELKNDEDSVMSADALLSMMMMKIMRRKHSMESTKILYI